MAFVLDRRLQKDCFVIGRLEFCQVLLLNNAALPWFVVVPETSVTEICDLAEADRVRLWSEVNSVAEFVRSTNTVDKLNVAAIGNVVKQLHVHVVGRRQDDYCWPGVVWGSESGKTYLQDEVSAMRDLAAEKLSGLMA